MVYVIDFAVFRLVVGVCSSYISRQLKALSQKDSNIFSFLQDRLTDAVSVLTRSADISTYLTIMKIQPYLESSLLEEVLSWRGQGK